MFISPWLPLIIAQLLAPNPVPTQPINPTVNDVVTHLVGVMDTSAQATANPQAPSVRMTTCKVTIIDDPNGVYLYQEQALTKKLATPYRQRFLEIQPTSNASIIESQSFKPKNPEILVGFCQRPEVARQLSKIDLGESICRVYLKPIPEGYQGETPPEGCPANVRGAVTITNTIILHKAGMDTWDKGFDAQGKQVWGAENESYQYRWVTLPKN